MTGVDGRPAAVVCGTRFGRIYLAALARPDSPFRLVGVLGAGSTRTRHCAEHYGVPLFTAPEQVPAEVTLACVVVSATINGGPGATLAQRFLRRGVHVVQEHPLHADELAGCLREARRAGLLYRVHTLYPQVEAVRRFLDAARELRARQPVLFADATAAFQVAYTLFDLLGRALGGPRPWAFGTPAGPPPGGVERVYRSVDGVLGGVPLSLRLQHEMDPSVQDNFTHLFHRITLGFEGGHLTLANTHGPVLWSPRPHLPDDATDLVRFDDSAATHLDYPTARVLGPAEAPSYRQVLATGWPEAVVRALWEARAEIDAGPSARADARHGQYHLTLSRLTKEVLDAFGPVRLRRSPTPHILPGPADVPLTAGPVPAAASPVPAERPAPPAERPAAVSW